MRIFFEAWVGMRTENGDGKRGKKEIDRTEKTIKWKERNDSKMRREEEREKEREEKSNGKTMLAINGERERLKTSKTVGNLCEITVQHVRVGVRWFTDRETCNEIRPFAD